MINSKILIPLLGITKHGGSVVIYDIVRHISKTFNVTILTLSSDEFYLNLPNDVNIISLNIKKRNFFSILFFYFFIFFYSFKFKNILVTHFLIFPPLLFRFKFNFIFLCQGEEYIVFKNRFLRFFSKIIFLILIKSASPLTTSIQISKKYNIKYINLGIDNNFFKTTSLSLTEKKYDIIYFARQEKYKRFDLFQSIFSNTNYKCIIVTNQRMLINFYIAKNFDYKYIDNIYDLIGAIDSSKLTILTSDYEGLGLPPLECMSRGVIPIIRSCQGPSTYALNNYNSIILPSNASNNDYLDTVSSLLGNTFLLKQLSCNAVITAKQFSRNSFLEDFSNELISFYKNE